MADNKSSIWKKVTGPSAGLVQQHYVKARESDLHRRNPDLEGKVKKLLEEHQSFAHLKLKGDKWLDIYRKINKNIQAADLTINFSGESWFSTENNYETYTQMYERSVDKDGKVKLINNMLNPADVRARVDDAVTFPEAWNKSAPAPTHRGLRPGAQSGQRIQTQMAFGEQKAISKDGRNVGVESLNSHFNPKTKQVFAALNYGRRPHGSSTGYGQSHLVLHPRFKVNSFYYAGDTFFISTKDTTVQMPFGTLAAIMVHAKPSMVDAIIRSCYFGAALDDIDMTGSFQLLLEAHLFSGLSFSNNISEVRLSAEHAGSEVHKNASKFSAKHGAKLVLM